MIFILSTRTTSQPTSCVGNCHLTRLSTALNEWLRTEVTMLFLVLWITHHSVHHCMGRVMCEVVRREFHKLYNIVARNSFIIGFLRTDRNVMLQFKWNLYGISCIENERRVYLFDLLIWRDQHVIFKAIAYFYLNLSRKISSNLAHQFALPRFSIIFVVYTNI